MAVVKPNREIIINEVLAEMDFGSTYSECLVHMAQKWSIPTTSFKRYWATAKLRYEALSQRTQQAVEDVKVEAAVARAKSRILDKHERMEILSQIARGEVLVHKPMVCDGVIAFPAVEADWQSRKAAIAELNKMDGEYAPIKKEITADVKVDQTIIQWGDAAIKV